MTDLKALVRTIPDHPKPGIRFRDITTLLADPRGFRETVARLADPYHDAAIAKVAGIEARGFILGGAVAERLSAGFVPVRKPGKLPGPTIGRDYALEYGADRVEVHVDAIRRGERVLIVDDLIATGGTALAAASLVEELGGQIAALCFAIELPELGGRRRLEALGHPVFALMAFEGH